MQEQVHASQIEEKGIHFKFTKMEKIEDLSRVKNEIREDRILVINITLLLREGMEHVEYALQELHSFCIGKGFSLARMGQGRILVLPSYIRF